MALAFWMDLTGTSESHKVRLANSSRDYTKGTDYYGRSLDGAAPGSSNPKHGRNESTRSRGEKGVE